MHYANCSNEELRTMIFKTNVGYSEFIGDHFIHWSSNGKVVSHNLPWTKQNQLSDLSANQMQDADNRYEQKAKRK